MNVLSFASPSLDLGSVAGGAAGTGKTQFELRVGAFVRGELTVVSYEGFERLSTPYEYDVQFSASAAEPLLQMGIFGFPACLSIDVPGHEPRVIQGLAAGFGCVGAADVEIASNARRYSLKIVPRLWLLHHSRKYRVFQDRSAIEIACAILDDAGIPYKKKLATEDYPRIPFAYQRGETDLEFVHRILATAGIFYFFQHATGLLDELMPGAGAVAGLAAGLGGMASAAGGLSAEGAVGDLSGSLTGGLTGGAVAAVGGALGGVGNVLGAAAKELGAVTTLVLCDQGARTLGIRDGAELTDGAMDLAGAALGATGLGSALSGVANDIDHATMGIAGGVAGAITDGPGDALPYDANGQAATASERVFSFRVHKEVRPRAVVAQDWCVADNHGIRYAESSALASLEVNAGIGMTLSPRGLGLSFGVSADLNVDAIPIATKDVSVVEYQRDAAVLAGRGGGLAQHALAQLRSDWIVAHGESDCRRLAAGYRFQLAGHPVDPVNTEYVVTEVRTRGFAPDETPREDSPLFRNVFVCVPASTDPRPRKPPPQVHGPETAMVVGPTWGDVNTDHIGRIQVQFHWATGDEGVCWVQWVERWGGDGYGTLSIPRVGSEVVVEFMQHAGGRPIATGQVYSADNSPPFDPGLKVGIRTKVGEISIDDSRGGEALLVSSRADLRIEGDQTTQRFGALETTVAEDRREVTLGDTTIEYAKDVTTTIAGTVTKDLKKDRIETVAGSVIEQIGGDVTTTVLGRSDTTVQAEHRATYEDDVTQRYHGHYVAIVGADESKSACLHVEGRVGGYAKGAIELTSLEGFTLTCGKSQITIGKDCITLSSPSIVLGGKTFEVTASDSVSVAAKTATLAASDAVSVSGNKVTLSGQSATVALDTAAKVTGSSVKLGSGSGGADAASSPGAPKRKVSTIKLCDPDGKPLANERVVLRKGGEGGEERVIVLDADGKADVEGDERFEVVFPEAGQAQAR